MDIWNRSRYNTHKGAIVRSKTWMRQLLSKTARILWRPTNIGRINRSRWLRSRIECASLNPKTYPPAFSGWRHRNYVAK
jgi:hypothetical protein